MQSFPPGAPLPPSPPYETSAEPQELAKFAAMAETWWDPDGEFRPLHRINPTRLAFIRDRAAWHFGRDPLRERPLGGLRLLDIGCGGGLLAEPLSRLGADVTGIDPVPRNIAVARHHADLTGLPIHYRACTAETLLQEGAAGHFDIVLAMEVVEHVHDAHAFIGSCAALLVPRGLLFLATLNRTIKAFALAIVGAEYVLRWLPRGTHEWRKFVRPSELAGALRRHGLEIAEIAGVGYHPLTDSWGLSRDLDVNYMVVALRP